MSSNSKQVMELWKSCDQTKEIDENTSNKSESYSDSYSDDSFAEELSLNSEDEIKESEEARKLLNDLSKDLKTKAIENINFNSYFDKIDEEYVKSRFIKYIENFINNYHDESKNPFNYIENDIIFRIAIVLGIFETKEKDHLPESENSYYMLGHGSHLLPADVCGRNSSINYYYIGINDKNEIYHPKYKYINLNSKIKIEYPSNIQSGIDLIIDDNDFNYKLFTFSEFSIPFCSRCLRYRSISDKLAPDNCRYLLRLSDLETGKLTFIKNGHFDSNCISLESYFMKKINGQWYNYESKEFEDLLTSEINSLLLTISEYKLPTLSKFSLEGLNFQKFKDEIELKKQDLNNSIEEIEKRFEKLKLINKSIEELISTNLKRNEELENQIKNKEIKIYNLNKQIDDLEQTYKSFKRFEDFQGFFEDTSISEYQKLKQVEHDYQEYQKRSDEMKAYDEIIQNFELYRNSFLLKSRDYYELMEKRFQDKKQKLRDIKESLENDFEDRKNELEEEYLEKKDNLKNKKEKLDKTLHKAINDANDKQKYWQNIIEHAEEHITSKLQKQLQEQINQFSKFNSAKWDSQVSFNIISTILKSINHKGDLIRLGIKTDELEFKNLNEVLKCIQIFNMFGLCTNDKNENVLMNKFTFNFIDKINSYMKQFSVLDPDYKK